MVILNEKRQVSMANFQHSAFRLLAKSTTLRTEVKTDIVAYAYTVSSLTANWLVFFAGGTSALSREVLS